MLQVFNPSGTIEKHIGQENRNLFFRGAGDRNYYFNHAHTDTCIVLLLV